MSPPPSKCCSNTRENGIDNVMKAWGKVITSLPGKVIVCLCSLLLLSGGIYGAININESFNRQLLTTENSHFREFLNVYEENFQLNIEVNKRGGKPQEGLQGGDTDERKMPKEGSFIEFKDLNHVVFKPFAIYMDCESRLEKVDVKKENNTTQTHVHRNAGYCYRFVSRVDPSESCTVQYTAKTNEENVSDRLVKTLPRHVMEIGKEYAELKPMIITEEERAEFNATTSCWICGKGTVDGNESLRKVRDHCHFSGKYRGAAHNICNLALKEDKTIPVAFHNGRRYGFHLFVRSLGRVEGHMSTIAKNSEQYISIDKAVYVSEKNTWKIWFIDSYGFLQASLENLVENFPKKKFKMLGEAFEGEMFDLVLRKGVFPYEWFDDIEKLNETEFPPIEAFYSSLT